jgi:hypothetical protein
MHFDTKSTLKNNRNHTPKHNTIRATQDNYLSLESNTLNLLALMRSFSRSLTCWLTIPPLDEFCNEKIVHIMEWFGNLGTSQVAPVANLATLPDTIFMMNNTILPWSWYTNITMNNFSLGRTWAFMHTISIYLRLTLQYLTQVICNFKMNHLNLYA